MQNLSYPLVISLLKKHLKATTEVKDIDLEKAFKGVLSKNISSLDSVLDNLKSSLIQELKKIIGNTQMTPYEAFKTLEIHKTTNLRYLLNLLLLLIFNTSTLKALRESKFPDIPQDIINALQNQINAENEKIIRTIEENGKIEEWINLTNSTNMSDIKHIHDIKQYKDKGITYYVKDSVKSRIYKILTSIENEGIREIFGSTFYHAMGVTDAAEAGVCVNSNNEAVKIFSKKVGEVNDKVISLGQLKKLIEKSQDDAELTEDQQAFKEIKGNHQKLKDFLEANHELKNAIIRAHAVSMLVGNRDLHNDNIMIVKKPDGELKCAPIDFGLSGHKVSQFIIGVASKLGCIEFNQKEMRTRDSLELFSKEEFKKELKEATKEFKQKKEDIQKRLYLLDSGLKARGVSTRSSVKYFLRNVEANVRAAERFCGMNQSHSMGI
jgi:hypothetical protein